MAFRFNPRADSSDEDGGVDLETWTANARGTTTAKRAAPVAPVIEQAMDVQEEDEDEIQLSTFQEPDRSHQSPGRPSSRHDLPPHNGAQSSRAATSTPFPDTTGGDLGEDAEIYQSMIDRKLVPHIDSQDVDQSQYTDYTGGADSLRQILEETEDDEGQLAYSVLFDDFHSEEFDNGNTILESFNNEPAPEQELQAEEEDEDEDIITVRQVKRIKPAMPTKPVKQLTMSSTRPHAQRQKYGYVSTIDNIDGSEDELAAPQPRTRKRKQDITQDYNEAEPELAEEDEESEDDFPRQRRCGLRDRNGVGRTLRSQRNSTGLADDEENGDDDDADSDGTRPFLDSDLPGAKRHRTTRSSRRSARRDLDDDDVELVQNKRTSGRATRHQGGMQEVEIDDIYRSDSAGPRVPIKPKAVSARETFKDLPRGNEFRIRHNQYCHHCGDGTNFASLINCQGCTLAYHKSCIGPRTSRDHLVTKVGEDDFVLQCRRCIAVSRKKDATAPDQGKCQECHEHGASCRPFRRTKTAAQEQKERDENDGVDPVYDIHESRINNPDNVLFRCISCFRGFHFEHLPSLSDTMELDVDAEQRFREYSRNWKCKECADMPAKISGLIAWKPLDEDSYDHAQGVEGLEEEQKVYLVKWDGMSYFRARWMPGPWVWGVAAVAMRKAFAKREEAIHPKMRTEDAIPEDFLRTDIVLDIKYTSIVDSSGEKVDRARIREIDQALIKYKGLGYEDAVWEAPPSPEDGERWSDFVVAYEDWVKGRYVRQPKPRDLRRGTDKARKAEFEKLEKKEQPENVVGGKLMQYQVAGLNWLYFKWYTQANAILADEMGLGKTIQIIGFLAMLVQDWSCYPFLIVVPNSTCPNWRREIKRWAPSLRVVAYYGTRESRDLAYQYELYPGGSKDLRCHIVVTSYDAAADENCRKFFRGVPWQGLIVDEGQRLKNDNNLLYAALTALKAPFKVLLTGTPLQNNQRELFNLLHFLDEKKDAAALEEENQDLDEEKIHRLHELIRPYFLRRTKAQVLTFLPPMAQIIIPVSMTIVQKKLYRNILAKNPDLMRAIFASEAHVKQGEKGSLNNILMQLRKCLCHPFVYNKGIEERNVTTAASHRNLVDASSKLMLLELLLPKLKERGHRVLIFSQFLDMLDIVEDFMEGMELKYQRLDGQINALVKQKRIDEFNAPDSPLFAFLLSTRAGGVGINLASADTVIILDPDFNPHQDIQALSRAHRIGQNKKVLCFQLVTRASAEERIMQIGRKKLALDHVLIQEIGEEGEETSNDLVSVLRHGASELFEDSGEQDIAYDAAGIERLLDRSHMENTAAGTDKSAEAQFSQARIWANDSDALEDTAAGADTEENAPDPGVWANILKERERIAADEAAARAEEFGRGRRARANVDYKGDEALPQSVQKKGQRQIADESDTDFQEDFDEDEGTDGEEEPMQGEEDLDHRRKKEAPTFRRAIIPTQNPNDIPILPKPLDADTNGAAQIPRPQTAGPTGINCRACNTYHFIGSCPLKLAGVEHCPICGCAHFSKENTRVCPHFQSETQVRAMQDALKLSKEPQHLVREAAAYLRGLKGNLVRQKKLARELAATQGYAAQPVGPVHTAAWNAPGPSLNRPTGRE